MTIKLLEKTDITTPFTSEVVDVVDARRMAIHAKWSAASLSVAVIASGNINTENTANSFSATSHELLTGMKVQVDGALLPAPLLPLTDYFVIRTNANIFKLATSLANANAGTEIDITDIGSGTIDIIPILPTGIIEGTSGDISAFLDTLSKSAHGLVTGDVVQISSNGVLPDPLLPSTDYHIIRSNASVIQLAETSADALLGNEIDLTDIGIGNQTLSVKSPAPVTVDSGDIEPSTDVIRATSHPFVTGLKVQVTTSDTLPGGIIALTDYWVIRVDANSFKLSDSLAHALAGTDIIDISSVGEGTQTFTPEAVADMQALAGGVDTFRDTLFQASHEFLTGLKVQAATTDTLPSGLVVLTDYWVISVDSDHFKLASSLSNANSGTAIDLDSLGVGTQTIAAEAITPAVAPSINIDIGNDEFTSVSHELLTGLKVQVTTSDTLPGGLALLTDYWVVVTGPDTFKLSDSKAHAIAGTDIIDITDTGIGDQTFTAEAISDATVASGGIDSEDNSFNIVAHEFLTGYPVTVDAVPGGSVLPIGLSTSETYWIVRVNDDKFRLSNSLANALAGTDIINIQSIGSGNTEFTFKTVGMIANANSGDIFPNATNVLRIPSHGLFSGQPVRISTSGTLPNGLSASTTYFVDVLDNDNISLSDTQANALIPAGTIAFTTVGLGTQTVTAQPIADLVFASGAIDDENSIIYIPNHSFITGSKIQVTTSVSLPSGIIALTDYFVRRIDNDNFRLAPTLADALANTNLVDVIDRGSGTQTFTYEVVPAFGIPAGAINSEGNTFLKANHGFTTGVKVRATTSNTLPDGLLTGTDYFVIRVSANLFKLATSLANANAGIAIDILNQGIGNQTITPTSTSATLKIQACLENPADINVTPVWIDVSTAETITSSGEKLWEFVDKVYHSVRLYGTISAGAISWEGRIRWKKD